MALYSVDVSITLSSWNPEEAVVKPLPLPAKFMSVNYRDDDESDVALRADIWMDCPIDFEASGPIIANCVIGDTFKISSIIEGVNRLTDNTYLSVHLKLTIDRAEMSRLISISKRVATPLFLKENLKIKDLVVENIYTVPRSTDLSKLMLPDNWTGVLKAPQPTIAQTPRCSVCNEINEFAEYRPDFVCYGCK